MDRIVVSVDDFNRRYAYCSGIPLEQITLCTENCLRIPFYRWDPAQLRITRIGFLKYVYEYPLYKEWVEFRSLSRYVFHSGEQVSEYVLFYKLRHSPQGGKLKFDTDFPFPAEILVSSWDVVVYPSDRVVGKYIERITFFLLGEGFSYEFVLNEG